MSNEHNVLLHVTRCACDQVLQYPFIMEPTKPTQDCYLKQIQINLMLLEKYQQYRKALIVWVQCFETYPNIFIAELTLAKSLREQFTHEVLDFRQFIDALYLEYRAWLDQCQRYTDDYYLKKRKQDFHTFFVTRCPRLQWLKDYQRKQFNDNIIIYNPMINFWYSSIRISTCLSISQRTCYLPKVDCIQHLSAHPRIPN